MKRVYYGNLIYTESFGRFISEQDAYIIVEDGVIKGISTDKPASEDYEYIDYSGKLIIPSFTDLHLHAVQYMNCGIGYDMELLPWLKNYTYPEEKKFADLEYAAAVFGLFVDRLWEVGSLRSTIFSSLHEEATLLLFEMMHNAKLSAFVGKTSMDRNTFHGLTESAQDSIEAVRRIRERTSCYGKSLSPIITPRFIPTCSDELLKGLGLLAEELDLPVQSHLNENRNEVKWVAELMPEAKNYLDAYSRMGLIREGKTIMAHAIYNTEEELRVLAESGIYAAHCPSSNLNLSSGIMHAKEMVNRGIKVGLGSDISGGDDMSIPRVIVDAIKSSKILSIETGDDHTLSLAEAFYLATKGGGSFFGKCGSFEEGYSFDALIVDQGDLPGELSPEEKLQRFIYSPERGIIARYLMGEEVLKPNFS